MCLVILCVSLVLFMNMVLIFLFDSSVVLLLLFVYSMILSVGLSVCEILIICCMLNMLGSVMISILVWVICVCISMIGLIVLFDMVVMLFVCSFLMSF